MFLLDMSKAFDTVDRRNLLEDLKGILNTDKLNIMHLLSYNVEIGIYQ